MRNSTLENPKFLARTIGDWLNSCGRSNKSLPSYAEVPKFTFDQGEYTFRNHCAACHTIGRGDHLGPDLLGVSATRDRKWLERFITEPDKMIAAGDPIATSLLAKYKQVLMPNLDLERKDAAVVLDYIDAQTRTMRENPPASAPPSAASASSPAATLTAIVDPYLRTQVALTGDTFASSRADALAISSAAARLGPAGSAIDAAARELQSAADLVSARAAFARLGNAVMSYAKESGVALGADVKVAYCPMLQKYWRQLEEQIQNPFYGTQMSDCGRINADLPALYLLTPRRSLR